MTRTLVFCIKRTLNYAVKISALIALIMIAI